MSLHYASIMMEVKAGRTMLVAALVLIIGRTHAFNFNLGPVPKTGGASAVDDERRREILGVVLSTVAVDPSRTNAENGRRTATRPIDGVRDPRLRDYRSSHLPDWRGTSLPGPLSLSEACSRIDDSGDPEPVLSMGRWPDPILRHPSSPVPSSVFRSESTLGQLQTVARALKNTARREGAVGLAAQQCGVDASLIFIDDLKRSGLTKNGKRNNDAVWGGETNGVFGQSSWRKSQKEVSGEGAYNDDDFPVPKTWTRTQNRQPLPKESEMGIFLVNPRIVHRSPESEMLVWTEQCLVLPPEFRATLLRDAEVTVEYESLECLDGSGSRSSGWTCGTTKQITLEGELARCAQHEMDHDRGTLIVDHVSLGELLSFDGEPLMANIENADGLHPKRMDRAYARDVSESTLLPKDEKYVSLAMEDTIGYGTRCTRVKAEQGQILSEDRHGPWFVRSANAIDQNDVIPPIPATTPKLQSKPTQSGSSNHNPECGDDCLEERRRLVEQRCAMMRQSRSNTRREDVLKSSEQRASLYGTGYKGLSPQTCSRPGFCP